MQKVRILFKLLFIKAKTTVTLLKIRIKYPRLYKFAKHMHKAVKQQRKWLKKYGPIQPATGDTLDRIGEMIGVYREKEETDTAYREKIAAKVKLTKEARSAPAWYPRLDI